MNAAPKGVRRIADILDFIARSRVAPSSRQIFEHLALPRSSGYDLLRGLAERHFLHHQPSGHWVLGDEVYRLALSRFGLGRVASKIEPVLAALQQATQETAQLAVLHNGGTFTTHAFKSARSTGVIAEVGTKVPVNWTAAGRLLVSGFSDRRLHHFFLTNARPSPTRRAVMAVAVFSREAHDAAHRGYAIEFEQAQAGGCSVAAPVLGLQGNCVAAVSLVLPVTRFVGSRDTLVALVCATAAKLKATIDTPEAEAG